MIMICLICSFFLLSFGFFSLRFVSIDSELKRKRQKYENCRTLTQYFENNKREVLSFFFFYRGIIYS